MDTGSKFASDNDHSAYAPFSNTSTDARYGSPMGIPVTNQPHTTGMSTIPAPAQFTGWGHAHRDPYAINDHRGTDMAGAPADVQKNPPDPRDSMGQTGSVSDTGVSRVSYGNQLAAPKTF